MNFRRSQVLIGIQCHDQQIRAVSITRAKKSIQVNATAIVDIEQDTQQGQLKALMKIREQLYYKNELIIYTINSNDVIMKMLPLDSTLNYEEIRKYLTTQSPHIFGYDGNELSIDFRQIDSNKKVQHIQAVAAQKTCISAIKKLCSYCQFKLKIIDVDILSIERVLPYLSEINASKFLAIIVFHHKQLVFGFFTNQKNNYSVAIDYTDTTEIELAILPSIKRALQFFKNTSLNQPIDLILLIGDSKHLLIAQHYLSSAFTVKVSLATLSPNIIHTAAFDKRLFASLGAALWRSS